MKQTSNKLNKHHDNSQPDRALKNLQKIMDLSLDVICTIDGEGRFVHVSNASKKVWGYESEELVGRPYVDFVLEEDLAKSKEIFNRVTAGENVLNFENRYIRKDKTIVPLMWSACWEAEDKLIYAAARDASEKKETEEKLKKSEEKFRLAVERISDAFVALDKDWRYTYMNKKAGEIFDRDPKTIVGKNIWEEFPEGIDQPFYKAYHKAMEEQQYIHLEEYYEPFKRWFVNHIYPSSDGLSIYFKDITERKEEEERIRVKDERLVKAQEIGKLGYWEYESGNDMMWASEKALEIYGLPLSPSEIPRAKIEACIPDIERVRKASIDLIEQNKKYNVEYLIHPADGSEDKYLSSFAEVERDEDGNLTKMVGVVQDITERRKAEKRLKKAYKQTTNILESITDGFLTVDKNWTVKYWNKAAERIMGMSREEIIDKNLWDVYADAISTKFYTEFNRAMDETISIHFEDFFPPLDIWFGISIYPTKEGISVFFQDITESKHQESIQNLEKETLELFTSTSTSIEDIIGSLLDGVPKIHPDMLCSIMRIKDDKMYNLSSRQLPQVFNDAVDGLPIGVDYGSFGAAAFLREKVEVADISTHLFWKDYKDVAIKQNLKASYSYPIVDSHNHLLGVFTIFYGKIHFIKKSEESTIERLRIILANIIESKLAEDALNTYKNQLELIYNTSTDAIFLLSCEGENHYEFLTVNNSFLATTGLKRNEIEGKYVEDVIPKESLPLVLEKYQQAMEEGETIFWEETTKYPSGIKTGIVSVSPVFSENDECIKLVGVVHDITERKKSEEEIKRSNEELKIKNEELEEKNVKLEDIAWIQSHKVRAPVANIMGLVTLLKKPKEEQMDTDKLLDYLLTSANELDRVIREIVKKTEQVKKSADAGDGQDS